MTQEDDVEFALMESSDSLPDGVCDSDVVSGGVPDGPLTFEK